MFVVIRMRSWRLRVQKKRIRDALFKLQPLSNDSADVAEAEQPCDTMDEFDYAHITCKPTTTPGKASPIRLNNFENNVKIVVGLGSMTQSRSISHDGHEAVMLTPRIKR